MNSGKVFSLSIAMALLCLVACTPESQRTEPVTTTTDKGASTAPPAKEAEKADKALVRVANALPGSAPVDAFIGSAAARENECVADRASLESRAGPLIHDHSDG